jgi:hypothetical protein
MKNQYLGLFYLGTLCLLSGCRTTIDNLTPSQIPRNSSNIYTMTMLVHIPNRDRYAAQQNLRPFIVIDGKRQLMKRSEPGQNIFAYDYRLSDQRNEVNYYYELEYDDNSTTKPVTKIEQSQLFKFQVSDRCVLSLEAYRGIPGTKVVILGRGFQSDDCVVFEDLSVKTRVHNDHMIKFMVPHMETNRNYRLTLQGSQGILSLGDFFIDPAPIYSSTYHLELHGEERQAITLSVPHRVSNDLVLQVTTDIPEDIVMPEVLIPKGSRSVDVLISGNGYEASGKLFVEAPGHQLLEISVRVIGKRKEQERMDISAFLPNAFNEAEDDFSSGSSIDEDRSDDIDDTIVVE